MASCHDSLGYVSDTSTDMPSELPPPGDADGDGISDVDEGRHDASGPVDTDGDTIPDFEDHDSDGDTIPDIIEAGDADTTTPPADTDTDGTPDFRDLDSDANGILDRDEGSRDSDGDGVGDHVDFDNDGDGIPDITEIRGSPVAPPDSDGDGIPDHMDLDSDGDTISDGYEGEVDTDGDATPDYLDLDTDCDTIPDSTEAGDADIGTQPTDTDGDGMDDFRDPDSDDDGLTDRWEADSGLDPYSEDSDMDGISDLVEVAAGTDPLDASDNPRTFDTLVFFMPYSGPADPPIDPEPESGYVAFSTSIQTIDVFFALDSSGSMAGEINNLRDSIRTTVVPGMASETPEVWFGVGRLEDCRSCAHNMAVLQQMTGDIPTVEAALTGWSTCGGWVPHTQYLYALATGDVVPFLGWSGVTPTTWMCLPERDVGWPCFRRESLPVVVHFSDDGFDAAWTSCSPGTTMVTAIDALNSIGAKYIGVNSGTAHDDMVEIAVGTGSVETSGTPLVFDVSSSGTGLGTQVVDAIELLDEVPVEVAALLRDDLSDLVDTVAEFVHHVEADVVGGRPDPTDPSIICVSGLPVADLHDPFDGYPDTFVDILPGTPVCFDVHVKQNRTVPAAGYPQIFTAELELVGDSVTVLETREVIFVVPPEIGSEIVCDE